MGWFKRLFGLEKPQAQAQPMTQVVQEAAQAQSIDPAKVGLREFLTKAAWRSGLL